ncbi:O-acyltransferase WSD1 [Acorus gramineus]|uniref:O-acyltransferase WSD1 n=1 Tax=Acorus gramineus TaxID=55184 RepID=A0AAV8ZZ01_ACOGR|nr:O-acyltransferase WSD1 [Acorus gramineus]KAK1268646.1 O-acyltransferase WSD1 [Acorus gramineus]
MGSTEKMGSKQRLPEKLKLPERIRSGGSDEELTEPLSPAARLFAQPNFNCHIIAVLGVGERLEVDAVKAGLQLTLLRHPRFSCLQVQSKSGAEEWFPTKIALDNHLVLPDVDLNTDSPDKFIEDYVSNIPKTPLDPSKPQWELHLLNVRTSEAEAVGIFRIHHSLGDGVSLMSLLLACTRKTSDPDSVPTLPVPTKKAGASSTGVLLVVFKWLWCMFCLVWYTVLDLLMFAATLAFLKDTNTPVKGRAGVESRPKRFVHRTLSLDDVKVVKDMTGSTLADRMKDDKSKSQWGNKLGYIILPFNIIAREDPLDYVRRAKTIVDRKKKSLEAVLSHSCGALIVKVFGIKAAAALSHRMLRNTTMSFSNIVGPAEEIGFFGNPIRYIAPSVYGHPQALTFHFQSYMNMMKVVVAVDESVILDPHQLCEDLAESLNLMKDAATRNKSSLEDPI